MDFFSASNILVPVNSVINPLTIQLYIVMFVFFKVTVVAVIACSIIMTDTLYAHDMPKFEPPRKAQS